MPIFEFKCEICGKIFEKLSKMSEKIAQCPDCGSKSEKILSTFNAIGTHPFSKCASADSCPSAGKTPCSSGTCAFKRNF